MNQSEPQPPPGFTDAIIPGRYFKERGIHTEETLRKVGKGARWWNTFTVVWVAWLPFWGVLTAIFGSFKEFGMLMLALLSPYAIITLIAVPFLLIAYPGFYYLHYKQGVSLRHLSHSIFTTSPLGMDVIACRHWLAWWRAMFLPGVDIGNLKSRAVGDFVGLVQVASFLTPLWLFTGPVMIRLVADKRAMPQIVDNLLDFLASLSHNPTTLMWCWGVSAVLFWVNYAHGRKWVGHVADMSPKERAALPL